jgi:hypothetical protein
LVNIKFLRVVTKQKKKKKYLCFSHFLVIMFLVHQMLIYYLNHLLFIMVHCVWNQDVIDIEKKILIFLEFKACGNCIYHEEILGCYTLSLFEFARLSTLPCIIIRWYNLCIYPSQRLGINQFNNIMNLIIIFLLIQYLIS